MASRRGGSRVDSGSPWQGFPWILLTALVFASLFIWGFYPLSVGYVIAIVLLWVAIAVGVPFALIAIGRASSRSSEDGSDRPERTPQPWEGVVSVGFLILLWFVIIPWLSDGCPFTERDPVSGVWQGTITTAETVIDRYGYRTEYATTPFAVQLHFKDNYLNGLVKWGVLDMDDAASVIDSEPIAYGTVLDDSIHFSAQTSTAAAPAMGTYRATIAGDTMTGTLWCVGEGYENEAKLVGEFTLQRQ